jgi:hypothetical protein
MDEDKELSDLVKEIPAIVGRFENLPLPIMSANEQIDFDGRIMNLLLYELKQYKLRDDKPDKFRFGRFIMGDFEYDKFQQYGLIGLVTFGYSFERSKPSVSITRLGDGLVGPDYDPRDDIKYLDELYARAYALHRPEEQFKLPAPSGTPVQ